MTPKWLNVGGLFLDLVGVVLLFLFGMPFRIRTGGNTLALRSDVINEQLVRTEFWYGVLGWTGLTCIVIGTALQIWATLRQSPARGWSPQPAPDPAVQAPRTAAGDDGREATH